MNQEQIERERLIRTEMLLGEAAMERLRRAHVAVFGIGGVGGYAAEALARSGVGALTLVDHDVVSLSNLNRQIIATQEEIGKEKVDVMRQRIASIAPFADASLFFSARNGRAVRFFPVRLCDRCRRHGVGKNRDHFARKAGKDTGDQLYGDGK